MKYVIQVGEVGGISLSLSDAERALPLESLRTRILAPCREAFAERFPDHLAEYDAEEAKLIAELALA